MDTCSVAEILDAVNVADERLCMTSARIVLCFQCNCNGGIAVGHTIFEIVREPVIVADPAKCLRFERIVSGFMREAPAFREISEGAVVQLSFEKRNSFFTSGIDD